MSTCFHFGLWILNRHLPLLFMRWSSGFWWVFFLLSSAAPCSVNEWLRLVIHTYHYFTCSLCLARGFLSFPPSPILPSKQTKLRIPMRHQFSSPSLGISQAFLLLFYTPLLLRCATWGTSLVTPKLLMKRPLEWRRRTEKYTYGLLGPLSRLSVWLDTHPCFPSSSGQGRLLDTELIFIPRLPRLSSLAFTPSLGGFAFGANAAPPFSLPPGAEGARFRSLKPESHTVFHLIAHPHVARSVIPADFD